MTTSGRITPGVAQLVGQQVTRAGPEPDVGGERETGDRHDGSGYCPPRPFWLAKPVARDGFRQPERGARESDDLEVAAQLPVGDGVIELAPLPLAGRHEVVDELSPKISRATFDSASRAVASCSVRGSRSTDSST